MVESRVSFDPLESAMIVAPPCIIACPHCQGPLQAYDTVSGNSFGATYYSDGYRDAPMMPVDTGIGICGHCGQGIYRDEAKTILEDKLDARTDPRFKDDPAYQEPPMYRSTLNPQLLYPLIRSTTDAYKRRSLHMFCMWGHNHTRDKLWANDARDNLLQLLTYLRTDSPHDLCMSADVHRQLGDFEECIARTQTLLDKPAAGDFHTAARQIQAAAKSGISAVVKILPDA
jgi:hypothetical protein